MIPALTTMTILGVVRDNLWVWKKYEKS